jgi:hypothetical protein
VPRARILVLPLALLAGLAAAQELIAHVTYLVPEGAYVDAGTDQGLAPGQGGTVLRDGKPVAKAEVVAAAGRSARLRIFDGEARVGDLVRFDVAPPPAPAPPPDEGTKRPDESGGFVPLLERQKAPAKATRPRNVSHGWVAVEQYLQTAGEAGFDYWRTSLSSAGDVQRLGGAPWAIDWSFNASMRGGDAFDGSALDGARLDVYELALSRRLGEDGLFRFGRFVPAALPAAGYLDGALLEQRLSPRLRGGAALGFKPTRDDLMPSFDEPTGLLYGTFDAGSRRGSYLTASLGVLAAAYEGDADRLAALLDLFGRTGRLDVSADAVVDFDVGSALFESGTRLTEGDFDVRFRAGSSTTLRAGADYYENVDSAAERALLPVVDPLYFEGSGWRYRAGFTQALGKDLTLDAEVNFLDAPDTGSTTNWNVTLTRYGLVASRVGSVSLTVYGLEGLGVQGIGGRLSAYLPLMANRLNLQGALGFRAFDPDAVDSFNVTDVRLYASYLLSPRWTLNGGVSAAIGDSADYVAFDLGVQYRW